MKRLMIALEEQLEIEKLHDKELAANKGGEFDVLYDNLANDQKEPEEPLDDPDTEETLDEEVATESLEQELKDLTYSQESIREDLGGKVSAVYGSFSSAVASLVVLGIVYGPSIAKGLYKGVIYVFSKLARLLYVSSVTLSKYLDRRIHSFNRLQEDIKDLRKSMDLLKEKTEQTAVTDVKYTDQKVINVLKIGTSVDFTKNIDVLSTFIADAINGIGQNINDDIGAIKHLIAYAQRGSKKVPLSILSVKPISSRLTPGHVEGYAHGEEFTVSYKYNEALPSDVVLMATLPDPHLTSMDELTQAYNASSMTLGLDLSSFKEMNSVDYMTLESLYGFIDSLDHLCTAAIAHQSLYENIAKSKEQMKIGYKNYFMALVQSANKVTLTDSLAEQVYLKSMMIDKVYLTTAIDIHDYTAKIITYSLSYVKDNITKLS